MKPKSSALRWILPLLRYGLCAVAVLYLYMTVSWHDTVALIDQSGSPVRLLEEHESHVVVLIDDQRQEISRDRIDTDAKGAVDGIKYGIAGIVQGMDKLLAIISILIFMPVPILQSIRIRWMLSIQGVRIGYWKIIKISYAGNFFNFALPGTTGGDLIKAYYVSRYTHQKTEAITTIFLDRVVGLLGLMFLATTMLIYASLRGTLSWDPKLYQSLVVVLGGVWFGLILGCFVVFSRRLRHLIKLPELVERLPAGDQLLRIGRATVAMRSHKALLLAALLNTIVLQLLVVFSAYLMSRSLHMQGGFELYFICVPIGFLIAAIPISPPQAIGVMEAAYIQFFTAGGLNAASAAVAFALANRFIQLVWALPGMLVPLLGAHLPSKQELAELESTNTASDEVAPTEMPAGADK